MFIIINCLTLILKLLMWQWVLCSAFRFRWEKDGKEFGSETMVSGTLKAKKEEPLESYAGFYRCYASNSLGTAMTQTVKVIVERESPTQTRWNQCADSCLFLSSSALLSYLLFPWQPLPVHKGGRGGAVLGSPDEDWLSKCCQKQEESHSVLTEFLFMIN